MQHIFIAFLTSVSLSHRGTQKQNSIRKDRALYFALPKNIKRYLYQY